MDICDNCLCKAVCGKFAATGGVSQCEHYVVKRYGYWKKYWCDISMIGHEYCECSECRCMMLDTDQFWDSKFCPNCGSTMVAD